jgi:tetratricopeptide (TPR) repeat protein
MVKKSLTGKDIGAIPDRMNPSCRRKPERTALSLIQYILARFAVLSLSLVLMQQAPVAYADPNVSSENSVETDADTRELAETNRHKEAQSYKQLGDRHLSEDAMESAADAYQRALSLDREHFTRQDRVQMAVYLSWDNRLQSAIQELRLVLAEDPAYLDARVHLARIYGWAGDLKRSVAEADTILAEQPDHRDALLIKANALEWGGQYGAAIPLYEKIIEANDDFDAQVGLSSSLLYKGDRAGAARKAKSLTTKNSRQQKKLASLLESIENEIRPRVSIRYNRYADEDDNLYNRYSALYIVPIGNQEFSLNLGRTDSRGAVGRARADVFSLKTQFNRDGILGFTGAFGLSRLHGGSTVQYSTGQVRIDGRLSNTTLSVTAGSIMLVDTSELIANKIRKTNAGIEVLQKIHERLLLSGGYNRFLFSDGNNANDVQLQAQYRISLKPRFSIGYRGRFLDFEKQSHGGFFDPENYISHRIYSGLYLKREKFYMDFEVYVGKQDFKRYAVRTNDWITGGTGSIGITPVRGLAFEINASGGDFAAGSVSGFRYFTLGSFISYRF